MLCVLGKTARFPFDFWMLLKCVKMILSAFLIITTMKNKTIYDLFFNNIHPMQGPSATRGRVLSKEWFFPEHNKLNLFKIGSTIIFLAYRHKLRLLSFTLFADNPITSFFLPENLGKEIVFFFLRKLLFLLHWGMFSISVELRCQTIVSPILRCFLGFLNVRILYNHSACSYYSNSGYIWPS